MEHNRQKKDPSCNKKVTSSHPYETANWFTRASLGWMNSILRLGSKRPLVKEDIFPVRTEDSMEYLVSKLKSEWQHEINSCLYQVIVNLVCGEHLLECFRGRHTP